MVLFREQGLLKILTLREISMCWFLPFSYRQKVITESTRALSVLVSDSENSEATITANCSHLPMGTLFLTARQLWFNEMIPIFPGLLYKWSVS